MLVSTLLLRFCIVASGYYEVVSIYFSRTQRSIPIQPTTSVESRPEAHFREPTQMWPACPGQPVPANQQLWEQDERAGLLPLRREPRLRLILLRVRRTSPLDFSKPAAEFPSSSWMKYNSTGRRVFFQASYLCFFVRIIAKYLRRA